MWIALSLTPQHEDAFLEYLMNELESNTGIKLASKWSLTSSNHGTDYQLTELLCKTSRTYSLSYHRDHYPTIYFEQDPVRKVVKLMQNEEGVISDYLCSMCHTTPRFSSNYCTYESVTEEHSNQPVDLWTIYPEVLRQPLDLASQLCSFTQDGLAKRLTFDPLPNSIYLIHISNGDAKIGSLCAYGEVITFTEKNVGSPQASSSNNGSHVTVVTPKVNYRRHSTFTTPHTPVKIYRNRRSSNESPDPLVDEMWQVDPNRRLNFDFTGGEE